MDIAELADRLELVSTRYAQKYGIERDGNWYTLKLAEEVGELTQSYLKMTGQARQQGVDEERLRERFEDELADVLGQTLLMARYFNVDVAGAMQRKWLMWLSDSDNSTE
jgi:NTP pyrophosphatase (non-canonical NTP hydrolase)